MTVRLFVSLCVSKGNCAAVGTPAGDQLAGLDHVPVPGPPIHVLSCPDASVASPPASTHALSTAARRDRAKPKAVRKAGAARTCRRRGRNGLRLIMAMGTFPPTDTRGRRGTVEADRRG